MKNEEFELTAERKKQLKEIKKENVIERTLMVALSPAVLAWFLVRSPFVAANDALKAKDRGAKEAFKAGTKGFVKTVSQVKGMKKVFTDGTERLEKARKAFADEDLEKKRAQAVAAAEKARKEAEAKAEAERKKEAAKQERDNRAKAEKKGIIEMANSIANAVKVEKVADNYACMGYLVHFENGVEMRIVAAEGNSSAKLVVFKGTEKYELLLSDYEYSLMSKKAGEKKALETQAAKDKKIARMRALIKEGQRVK